MEENIITYLLGYQVIYYILTKTSHIFIEKYLLYLL